MRIAKIGLDRFVNKMLFWTIHAHSGFNLIFEQFTQCSFTVKQCWFDTLQTKTRCRTNSFKYCILIYIHNTLSDMRIVSWKFEFLKTPINFIGLECCLSLLHILLFSIMYDNSLACDSLSRQLDTTTTKEP